MVEVIRKGDGIFLGFSEQEAKELGLRAGNEYEFSKARDGIWLLTEGKERDAASKIDEAEQKIIGYLKRLSLSERVEGKFEKKLSPEELKKFQEMLAKKKVEKFKLNETYKNAVYQFPEKSMPKFENTERPFAEFTLENDGFLVVKNEERAKALSEQYKDKIKDGEIKGTRAFTGEFFIINSSLLENAEQKMLGEIRKDKKTRLEELSAKTGLTKTLARIAMEFLKEEGQVIEKRAETYEYIE